MYTETLFTPYPYDKPVAAQPLLDAVRPGANQRCLEDVAGFDATKTGRIAIEIADEASRIVHASLWFANSQDRKTQLYSSPFKSLIERQTTDCYGYTTVLSETLDACNIEHYIGYTNGHAMAVLPFKDEKGKHLYFLDALAPRFNQILDGSLTARETNEVSSQIATNGRAAVVLDSETLSLRSGSTVSELEGKYPWLRFTRSNAGVYSSDKAMGVSEQHEINYYRSRYALILSLFPSKNGREMLERHAELQESIETRDIAAACLNLAAMEGMFPEMDARQKHDELRHLVSALCEAGEAEEATRHVSRYFASNFSLSQDSRIPEAHGDFLRMIAQRTGWRSAARQAIEAYTEAAKRPKAFHSTLVGKIAAARSLQSTLALDAT